MLRLALDGITSLSVKPIHMITGLRLFMSIVSFVLIIWSIIQHSCGYTVDGWSSTTVIICFIGGIQMIALGVYR